VKCRRRVPHDDEPDGDDQPLSKKIELQTIICVGIPYWRFWNFSTGVNIPILNSVARASLRVVDAAQFYWSLAAIPLARSCSQKQRHAGASSPRKAIPARMAPSDDWGHIRTRSRLDRLLGVFVDRVYREFAFLKSMPHALVAPNSQAIFCRRRHQAKRPPLARIRPGNPAPAMGPGTATPVPWRVTS
jgi:hypothetical protein